jgi:hypothetical protein
MGAMPRYNPISEDTAMTYRGHMKDGVAVLDTPAGLPDGTPVRVEVERTDSAFWQNKSVHDLAKEQAVKPCTDPADLAGDWPVGESVDDFLALIKRSRV